MKLEIILDDRIYTSVEADDIGHMEAAQKTFDEMPATDCYMIHLKGGGILVLGKRAVQSAHFKFLP